MSIGLLLVIVIALGVVGYVMGRKRALQSVDGDPRKLHSLPSQYGQSVFLFTVVPALLTLGIWLLAEPQVINRQVEYIVAADGTAGSDLTLRMDDVVRIANGLDTLVANTSVTDEQLDTMRADFADVRGRLAEVGVAVGSDVQPAVFEAAKTLRKMGDTSRIALTVVVIALALAGFLYAYRRIAPSSRARTVSE
ncbi:phosphate ABC transporter permease family protein, partial [Denitromonas sp.]|uniref:phosphate ABC transporter permease family protein n=1 Tax=Denitromonas sp. TaxID=2734609 RepID=UPI003A8948FB